MSFKVFIYYCALCGGWAAFLAWAFVYLTGIVEWHPWAREPMIGAALGLLVAAAVGAMDALLNAVGSQRFVRVGLCLVIGTLGGALGGLVGLGIFKLSRGNLFVQVIGWILVGMAIGASIGVFDWVRAINNQEDTRVPFKKVLNGLLGGLLGGLIGGLPFGVLSSLQGRSSLTISLVLLGSAIGLMIGLAQVFLKEAWIKIESGRRAGREIMMSKDETTIGRAESCDIGLFGDNTIERLHAKIKLESNRYVLLDENTPAGTYVNGQKVSKGMPLKNGDLIRVGGSELRFGERQKHS